MQVYIVALFLFSNIIGINAWTTLDASWTENCNNGMLGRTLNDDKVDLENTLHIAMLSVPYFDNIARNPHAHGARLNGQQC